MNKHGIDWGKSHIVKVRNTPTSIDAVEDKDWRKIIEPWLTAIFQSEHLSVLIGSGFTNALMSIVGVVSQGMERLNFTKYGDRIKENADKTAEAMDRGAANFEDDFRTAMELVKGLDIKGDTEDSADLQGEVDNALMTFAKGILNNESRFSASANRSNALNYLKSFLISFSSRTATRDRLQVFTTNYDRFIEYGFDISGILSLDRFVGKINPVFRTTKLELDYHYNPPGIRGEPRYVEGVVRYTKLHGSIDWNFHDGQIVRNNIPFGAAVEQVENVQESARNIVIYPNSLKGIETAFYPYSELFRDFAMATCRPNSALVTYGYGFGDSHINRIIRDMLTIPSTHIVIISFDKAGGRIEKFLGDLNPAQYTLLIGEHFGDFSTLIEKYLPKAAIDRLTERMHKNIEKRGDNDASKGTESEEQPDAF